MRRLEIGGGTVGQWAFALGFVLLEATFAALPVAILVALIILVVWR